MAKKDKSAPQDEPRIIVKKKTDRERIEVGVSLYEGKHYLNIRNYYRDSETGDFKPGPKGIAIPIDIARKVLQASRKVMEPHQDVIDVEATPVKKKKRSVEEDETEIKPRKKKAVVEDDDQPVVKKKKKRVVEEEEVPKKKKRTVIDDEDRPDVESERESDFPSGKSAKKKKKRL